MRGCRYSAPPLSSSVFVVDRFFSTTIVPLYFIERKHFFITRLVPFAERQIIKMKKILLIFASFYKKKDLPEKKRIFWEPLGISYLASYLRKYGFIVDILYPLIDEMDEEQITDYLRKTINDYFIIGLSASDFITNDVKKYVSIIKELKFRGKIFLGGLGPTCNWREFVKTGVDAVIIGEGEKTLLSIARAIEKGIDYKTIPGLAFIKIWMIMCFQRGISHCYF